MMKISFKIPTQEKKEVKEAQTSSKFSDPTVNEEDDENEFRKSNVICLEDGIIIDDSSKHKKEKKEYCITLAKTQDWRVEKLKEKLKDGSASEEDKARLALMLESLGEVNGESLDSKSINHAIDENDFASGSKVDADYDAIPVEEFGLAFLRGCGWKKGEGIGKTNKRVVPLAISEARPKGLGLGSHIPGKPPGKTKNGTNDDQPTKIKINSAIRIISGKHKGSLGVLKSIDVDNASCFVELKDNSEEGLVRVSLFAIEVPEKKKNPEENRSSSSSSYKNGLNATNGSSTRNQRQENEKPLQRSSDLSTNNSQSSKRYEKTSKDDYRSHHYREKEKKNDSPNDSNSRYKSSSSSKNRQKDYEDDDYRRSSKNRKRDDYDSKRSRDRR